MSRRHNIRGYKLNRNTKARKALFKTLITSLILKEEIKTTAPKAKAVQGLFDSLVSKGRLGTLHIRRLLHAFLGDKDAVNKLVDDIAPRMQRNSGFTRITKLGLRRGDNAPIVKMEIIDKKTEVKPATEVKAEETKKVKKSAPAKKATK